MMNAIQLMAILYAKSNAVYRDFIVEPAFVEFSKLSEIIGEIERYHLPEITNTICASDELLELSWGRQYRVVADLWREGSFDCENVIRQYRGTLLNSQTKLEE